MRAGVMSRENSEGHQPYSISGERIQNLGQNLLRLDFFFAPLVGFAAKPALCFVQSSAHSTRLFEIQ
jgi:hypothetical protein